MKANTTVISMDAKHANMDGDQGTGCVGDGGGGCVEGYGGLGMIRGDSGTQI